MILSFKKQFIKKIIDRTKIHTIRADPKKRWKGGTYIHFASGVRTRYYTCFKNGYCTFVQAVQLSPIAKTIHFGLNGRMNELHPNNHLLFAKNDGFDSLDEFWAFFNEPFEGVIIHWADFVYH